MAHGVITNLRELEQSYDYKSRINYKSLLSPPGKRRGSSNVSPFTPKNVLCHVFRKFWRRRFLNAISLLSPLGKQRFPSFEKS